MSQQFLNTNSDLETVEDIRDLGHLCLHLTKQKINTKAQGETIQREEVDVGLKQTKIHFGSNSEHHTQSDKITRRLIEQRCC